jgi:hypothetical protein
MLVVQNISLNCHVVCHFPNKIAFVKIPWFVKIYHAKKFSNPILDNRSVAPSKFAGPPCW